MDYTDWLARVRKTLARLTNRVLSPDDFDYPWIEAWLKGEEPGQVARLALAREGFIVEQLPAPAMLLEGAGV
jgi:hypothetical protein